LDEAGIEMPYYITQTNPDCPNWAVEKEDGESIGCHDSKESAIEQAVAISIDEGTEFVGERAAVGSLEVGDFVSWAPLDPRVAAQVEAVQEQFAVVRLFDYEDGIFEPTDKMMVINVFQLEKIPTPKMIAVEVEDDPEDEPMDSPDEESSSQAVISDIDSTLITPQGARNEKVYAYLESFEDTEVIIVTARLESERADTVAQLESLDIDYDELLMKPNAQTDSIEWKTQTAEMLLETYNVMVAVDDNDDIRAAYSDLGITAIAPADVPTVPEMDEDRAINQEAPAYMRAAARRGLEYYEEGLAGDGVTPKTIREAREMAEGRVSDDKWIRIAAWIARHLVDLDSPDANPDSDNYPSAGVVAHLLWGSGPSKRAAQRTKDYADSVVARIRAEERNRMDNKDKWLKVARAIALKIDGPQAKEPEIRTNSVDFEVRAEGDGMSFTGYASVFNSPSEDLGGFIEYVAPGAFKRSLQSRNEVKLLWNHDSGEPLASLRGGTMQLVEDNRGLKVTAQLPNTTRGRDIAELLRTKVIDSMSFGFNVIKDSWSSNGQTRTLESVRLFEVSIVSFPAYEATTAQVRSAQTINPDQLADALLKLESGEELDEANANLITDVVNKLKAQPEIDEVIDNGLELLDLKKKQFDLLLKRI
jgi:HK97 family phage prohead protease